MVCIRLLYSILTRLYSAKLFRRVLGHGIRFGEAKNPGPDDLRLAICNPTSLTSKDDAFHALRENFHCHFIAASETSATQPAQVMAQRKMRQLGYFSAFTPPVPLLRVRADHQISLRGKAMGCACFSLAPVRHSRCPTSSKLGMDLRLLHVIVDEWKIQFVIVYGLAQSHAGAQEFNEELLAGAAQRVQQVNLPAIIMGDFNADVSSLPSAQLLSRLGFLHLQPVHSTLYGMATPPTCKEATNPDTAFVSPELLPRLHSIQLFQEPLFDAHKVVLMDLKHFGGNLYKQVWPKPKPFTDFAIPQELLARAHDDLCHLPAPDTLETWGHRVEQTVDVALRKMPTNLSLPRSLPKAFRGRCVPKKPKQLLVTSLVPHARQGDFEPEQEISCISTASMVKQQRRIQSLKRKIDHAHLADVLILEWRRILKFVFKGRSFISWMYDFPELSPVPWTLPDLAWLHDLEQLWKHEVTSAIALDRKIQQDKQAFRLKLDKTQGHNKQTFASVRGATPKLESVEQTVEQTAILVPIVHRVTSKAAARFEAFVEDPRAFQIGQPILLNHKPGCLHEIGTSSLVVSCNGSCDDLEQVEVQQQALITNPKQICQQLTEFWQPIWQRDDSHLMHSDLDEAFTQFLHHLPQHDIQIDSANFDLWKSVISKLRWNAAPVAQSWTNACRQLPQIHPSFRSMRVTGLGLLRMFLN